MFIIYQCCLNKFSHYTITFLIFLCWFLTWTSRLTTYKCVRELGIISVIYRFAFCISPNHYDILIIISHYHIAKYEYVRICMQYIPQIMKTKIRICNALKWSLDASVCRSVICRRFVLSRFWFVDVFFLSRFWVVDVLFCWGFVLSTFGSVDVSVCRRFGCRSFGLSTFWPVTNESWKVLEGWWTWLRSFRLFPTVLNCSKQVRVVGNEEQSWIKR